MLDVSNGHFAGSIEMFDETSNLIVFGDYEVEQQAPGLANASFDLVNNIPPDVDFNFTGAWHSLEYIEADGVGRARGTGTTVFETTSGPFFSTYTATYELLGNPQVVFPVPLLLGMSVTHDAAGSGDFTGEVQCPVPESSTLGLVGVGMIGLLGYGWRRRRVR